MQLSPITQVRISTNVSNKIIGMNVQIKSQMERNPIKVIQVSTNVAVKRPHLSGLCHHGCKTWKH